MSAPNTIALGVALVALAVALPGPAGLWLRLHGDAGGEAMVEEDATGMAAMIQTAAAPTARIEHASNVVVRPLRREGRPATASGEAAPELDAEVTRLLRVRGGELAEPLLWQRPSHRREVDEIVDQLRPIRSRVALLSSWERESRRGPSLRLAYAIVWLRLAQRRAGEYGPCTRTVARRWPIRARG